MHLSRHELMAGCIVPKENDDVRAEAVALSDDVRNALLRHPGLACMDVGERCDAQAWPACPVRRRNPVADDPLDQQRLHTEGVAPKQNWGSGYSGGPADKLPARDPHADTRFPPWPSRL
jgi:hypothetical protein